MKQLYLIPETEFSYIDRSVERVKMAYGFTKMMNPNNKLRIAFSGGKDSVCVYGVCKLAFGDKLLDCCDFQYNVTNVDPPELVQFIRKEFPFVRFHRPEKTMWQLIVETHMPPLRNTRYCCAELKEVSNITGQYSVTGVRHAESPKRAERGSFEIKGKTKQKRILLNDNVEERNATEYCMQKNAYICNPIVDWSDNDVWNFIHKENIPYCKLYDEGWKRLGCIGCPLAQDSEREKEFRRWPGYYKQYIRTFEKMLAINRIGGDEYKNSTPFLDGQDVMDWWLHRPAFIEKHQNELSR